jgi:DNA-binding MarR family transcriptional regulator
MTAGLDAHELETWRVFQVMRRQLDLTLERRLQADAGISTADFAILVSLEEHPDRRMRAGRIGDLIGWEKSRVSHQLSRMEQRGLIHRTECGDDARGVWIEPTADGRRAVLAAMRDHTAAIRQYFFGVVNEDEQRLLADLSRRVLEAIDPPLCHPESDSAASDDAEAAERTGATTRA